MTITDLARICHFAQDHIDYYFSHNEADLKALIPNMMEPASHVIACFLAQSTEEGHHGVEWEIVHDDLCLKKFTVAEWEVKLEKIIKELGGMKS